MTDNKIYAEEVARIVQEVAPIVDQLAPSLGFTMPLDGDDPNAAVTISSGQLMAVISVFVHEADRKHRLSTNASQGKEKQLDPEAEARVTLWARSLVSRWLSSNAIAVPVDSSTTIQLTLAALTELVSLSGAWATCEGVTPVPPAPTATAN